MPKRNQEIQLSEGKSEQKLMKQNGKVHQKLQREIMESLSLGTV